MSVKRKIKYCDHVIVNEKKYKYFKKKTISYNIAVCMKSF